MSDKVIGGVLAVMISIIGVAIIATLVSKQANTAGVLQGVSSAFSGALGCALSPIGGSCSGGGSMGSIGQTPDVQSSISFPGIN